MATVTNDAITCSDIAAWDDKFIDGDPAVPVIEPRALLGRARETVREPLTGRQENSICGEGTQGPDEHGRFASRIATVLTPDIGTPLFE